MNCVHLVATPWDPPYRQHRLCVRGGGARGRLCACPAAILSVAHVQCLAGVQRRLTRAYLPIYQMKQLRRDPERGHWQQKISKAISTGYRRTDSGGDPCLPSVPSSVHFRKKKKMLIRVCSIGMQGCGVVRVCV